MTAILLAALSLAATDPSAQDTSAKPDSASAQPPAKSDSTTVGGVVVNGERPQVETSIDRRSYSVASDLQATTGTVGDVLRNIPSVQVDVQGNVSLRGDPNVTVLVDGKPSSQFSADNLAQALQSTPADRIDRIEVITNPSAEFRADGTGGIINLITKKAKGAGQTGSVRVQAINAGRAVVSANAGLNTDKLSVTTDATYRRDRGTLHGDLDQTTLNPVTGVPDASRDLVFGLMTSDYGQGHVGADYDLTDKTRVSASLRLMSANTYQTVADQFAEDNDAGATASAFDRVSLQHIMQDNGEVSLILRHKYAEANDLTVNLTYNGNELIQQRVDTTTPTFPAGGSATDVAIDRTNFNRHTFFNADYERPLWGMAKLKLGYDFDYNGQLVEHAGGTGVPGGPITPSSALIDNFADDDTHHQAYVTYDQPFGKLDALFGVRAEVVHLALDQQTQHLASSQDYTKLYPTLHLAYDLDGGRKLTASYSKRVLRPQPIDLDPFVQSQSPGVETSGNPDLKPQETNSVELGYEQRKDAASLVGTLWYHGTENAFSSVFTDLGGGTVLQTRANLGHQQAFGAEVAMSNKLTPKITYNFSIDGYWAEVSAPNLGLIQTRTVVTGFGRANLNWQLTPKDFLQLNVFANAESIVPQGYTLPTYSGNIGYRHTVNNKVSWMIVAQDPFHTFKYISVLNSGGVSDHRVQQASSRMVSASLVWNFSGKPKDTGFDFAPGGAGGGG